MRMWEGVGRGRYVIDGAVRDIKELAVRFKASGLADGMCLSPRVLARSGSPFDHARLLDKMAEVGFIGRTV